MASSTKEKTLARSSSSADQAGGLLVQKRLLSFQWVSFNERFIGDTITVGRTRHRDVRIRDEAVSALHCELQRQHDGSIVILDCDSKHGIWLSDPEYNDGLWRQVTRATLVPGMRLRLGNSHLLVTNDEGRSPIRRVYRYSEFVRRAFSMYGGIETAARAIGLSPFRIRRSLGINEKGDTQ